MRKLIYAALAAVPLAVVSGLLYANAEGRADQPQQAGYVCPITGEDLPCPNCCPLNQGK